MTGSRHLDLGCGKFPRNPYGRAELHGVDLRALSPEPGVEIRHANLVVEPIPYPDSHFASVSAFDFIEHVPRLFPDGKGGTRLPFIELMNEIWRVLEPGGLLYAVTPAWPHAQAFADPTHVNIIGEETLDYFTGDNPLGRMYGFTGTFERLRQDWVHAQEAANPDPQSTDNAIRPRQYAGVKLLAQRYRHWTRRMRGKDEEPLMDRHWLRWELRALGP